MMITNARCFKLPHRAAAKLCPHLMGFSLIEMSIVIAVLGLLVGGILVGSSTIRNGQLQAVVTEKNRWVSATNSFKEKYGALPGDMPNATSYWAVSSSAPSMCSTNSSAALSDTGTCNGNGDGKVLWCINAPDYTCKEVYWYWQHLSLSGMIEGKFRGSGKSATTDHYPGDTDPASRLGNNVVWAIFSDRSGNSNDTDFTNIAKNEWYSVNYGNSFVLRAQGNNASTGTLTPAEAASIDGKIDDGVPGTGQVIGKWWDNANTTSWGANRCTTSANSQDFAGTYNFALSSQVCDLFFVRQF